MSVVDAVDKMISDAKKSGSWDKLQPSPEFLRKAAPEYERIFGAKKPVKTRKK